MAHPLAADLGAGDFNAATLAHDAAEADALVLAAVALPVFLGTEDLLAEQPVLFRAEGAVVDRFGLLDLAMAPCLNGVGGGETDGDPVEIVDVEHCSVHLFLVLVRENWL